MTTTIEQQQLKQIIEAALLASDQPLTAAQLLQLFEEENSITIKEIREILQVISEECEGRGIELKELASGFCFRVKIDLSPWIQRLWEQKPARYSRALMETLAIIAYRQPITRGEIEAVRGVAVSTHIIKLLTEREWVHVVGHRDVPGKPALYATTKQFLDYFQLKRLSELPPLSELRNLDAVAADLGVQLALEGEVVQEDVAEEEAAQAIQEEENTEVSEVSEVSEVAEVAEAPEASDPTIDEPIDETTEKSIDDIIDSMLGEPSDEPTDISS